MLDVGAIRKNTPHNIIGNNRMHNRVLAESFLCAVFPLDKLNSRCHQKRVSFDVKILSGNVWEV